MRNIRSVFPPEVECPEPVEGLVWVYIIQCADASYYVGYSSDVPERLRKHRYGLGSKYTKDRIQPRLVFFEAHSDRTSALRRESQLKGWTRAKKTALIIGELQTLKNLSKKPV